MPLIRYNSRPPTDHCHLDFKVYKCTQNHLQMLLRLTQTPNPYFITNFILTRLKVSPNLPTNVSLEYPRDVTHRYLQINSNTAVSSMHSTILSRLTTEAQAEVDL